MQAKTEHSNLTLLTIQFLQYHHCLRLSLQHQFQKELLKEYKPVLARSSELEETQYQPLEQSDVKEIIHDVLQELQSRQNHKAKDDTKKD